MNKVLWISEELGNHIPVIIIAARSPSVFHNGIEIFGVYSIGQTIKDIDLGVDVLVSKNHRGIFICI